MAGSVNKVTLLGNLGAAPEVRSFQDGGKIATFKVATSENWKDKRSGERREKTEWHYVCVRAEKLVELVEKYLSKGSKVYIEGKLETRKWQDQNGNDRYTTEVVLAPFGSELKLLDTKDVGEARRRAQLEAPAEGGDTTDYMPAGAMNGADDTAQTYQPDDDIPF